MDLFPRFTPPNLKSSFYTLPSDPTVYGGDDRPNTVNVSGKLRGKAIAILHPHFDHSLPNGVKDKGGSVVSYNNLNDLITRLVSTTGGKIDAVLLGGPSLDISKSNHIDSLLELTKKHNIPTFVVGDYRGSFNIERTSVGKLANRLKS